MEQIITPVILSGGSGTRLWPVSRAARPKQMQTLTGAETLIQMTARRVQESALFGPPIVVASQRHAQEVEAQLGSIGSAPAVTLLEPMGRNTAAAIALAALEAPSGALLLVMPSDHVIQDNQAFIAAVKRAVPAALDDWLVTFGIHAQSPETGYGYIRRGAALMDGVFEVERFVEKPDRKTAIGYVADGRHDWNGGIFLFRAERYLNSLAAHAPDIFDAVQQALAAATRFGPHVLPGAEAFSKIRSDSIDYAVMERDGRVAVVPVEMGWSDVGSWDALYEIGARDDDGNVSIGEVRALDSRNCLLRSDGPLLVTIGVEDLVVIATGDVVMVLPRGEAQRVREAVTALQADDHKALDR